jgi:hypothetical protein
MKLIYGTVAGLDVPKKQRARLRRGHTGEELGVTRRFEGDWWILR